MRKFLIPLLVASALSPAAAQPQDRGFGRVDRSHGERSSQRDSSSDNSAQRAQRTDRSERAEPPVRTERVERSSGAEPDVRMERTERPVQVERNVQHVQPIEPAQHVRRVGRDQSIDSVQHVRRVDRDQSAQPMERVVRIDRGRSVKPVQRDRRVDRGDDGFVGVVRHAGQEAEGRPQGQVEVHRGDRDGFSGPHDRIVRNGDRDGSHWNGDRDGNHHRWNGDWRHDHRYDWRSHRSHHSSLYHYGRYYDPYGWGYRRFSIGFNLWPSYYGSSFWLNNPWQYRLPPAYGPYRWVRYYDDALLVNIYTGEVVDVVNNFFW